MGMTLKVPDMEEIKEINKAKKINTIILICGLLAGIMCVYEGIIDNEPMFALLGGGAIGISLIPMIVKLFYKVYQGISFIYYMARKPQKLKMRQREKSKN